MDTVFQWVTQYGYAAIFLLLVLGIVGLPIPDETILSFAGYLIYRGRLQLVPTLTTAFLGSICGISLSYLVGRTFGLYLVRRYGHHVRITQEKLDQVHRWFNRIGHWMLTFGYYVPGVRHLTAYVAGASKLDLPQFALFSYSGGMLWCTSFIALGYFLGEEWGRLGGRIEKGLSTATVIVLAIVVVSLLLRRVQARRRPEHKS